MMIGINSSSLRACPTCEALPVAYQRFRHQDHLLSEERFNIVVGRGALCDVVEYSCGCVLMRTGRTLFKDVPGSNGFASYDMVAQWTSHHPCSQAERIVLELREQRKNETLEAKNER